MGASGFDLSLLVQPDESTTLHAWWKAASDRASKERRREFNGIAIYIMWNIWKERNCRIFQGVSALASDVVVLALSAIDLRKLAFDPP